MTIFVDDADLPVGRMKFSHCWTDGPLEELLTMMDAVGVARKWIQRPPHASWVHFDISTGAKRRAIARGAILVDKFGPMEHVARIGLTDPDPLIRAKSIVDLQRVKHSRLLRSTDLFAPLDGRICDKHLRN